MDSIHKRQLSAQRRRHSSSRQLEQRRSRQQKETAQIARALIDEGKREQFAAPEMATIARKMTRVMLLTEDRGIRTIAEISGKAE
jgi:hypothetical protein